MSMEVVPRDVRGLKACLVCCLIKTKDQFEMNGCDNCESFLRLKNNPENVHDCTSTNFKGMISAMYPDNSWVCRWQRLDKFCKGVYAISVSGCLPDEIIKNLKSKGIIYKPRDHSK